jgi:hypothetical protein
LCNNDEAGKGRHESKPCTCDGFPDEGLEEDFSGTDILLEERDSG